MLFTRVTRTVGWRSTNETLLTPIHWEESLQTSNFKPSNYPWCNTFCKCNVTWSWKKILSHIWMKRELKWNQNYKSSLKTDSVSTVCIFIYLYQDNSLWKKRSILVIYPILMFAASFSALNINAQQIVDSHEWVDSRWSSDVCLTEITSTRFKNYFQREHRWVLRLWMKPSRAWAMQDLWGRHWYQYQNSSIDHNHRIHEHIWTLKCCKQTLVMEAGY